MTDEYSARLPPPVRRLCFAEGAVSFNPVSVPGAGLGASLARFKSISAATEAYQNLRQAVALDPRLSAVKVYYNRNKRQPLPPVRPPTPPTVGRTAISRNSGSWETEEGGSWRPHFLCWHSS
jgi:hypothetical protein